MEKEVTVPGYGCEPYQYDELLAYARVCRKARPYICDAAGLLEERQDKGILFEAQLGALRDLDYGIYPYTSSSTPLAAYAPVGCGLPSVKVDRVVGVVKAYSTCVGEGPFVGELQGDEAVALREAGHEYGAATGRPRRVTWMDVVAARYGVRMQAATELALTKMDVLDGFKELPVCVGYKLHGQVIRDFPYTADLDDCEPVYEVLPGWQCDTTHARALRICQGRAGLCALYREGAGLPHSLCIRGRRARRDDHPGVSHEQAFLRVASGGPLRQRGHAPGVLARSSLWHLAQAVAGAG